ncbi:type III secretion system stator protein SctL [Chloracidobacterium thermophilum]|uniref:type III secretion system stator protein SctL n=1 Tax=Chloracidobacterium thermophilum TaxID=458033 RepID=UPI000738AE1A|nr:type III secretion system stator protein SctL [Chloracidobacterium thermophilum]
MLVVKPSVPELIPLTGGIVKRAVVEARAESRRLLREAQAEADRRIAEAQAEVERIRAEAWKAGYEAGLAEFTTRLLDLQHRREALLTQAEQEVLRLALRVAGKIVGRELEVQETTLLDIVRTAMRNLRQASTVTICVNPADVPRLERHREAIETLRRGQFVNIVPDTRVSVGGCILESESGIVDAQLDTQLRVIEQALLEMHAMQRREARQSSPE